MEKLEIPYKPRYPEVHELLESHRFSVLVAHRRFGKTVLSVNHLIKSAMLCTKERGSYAYVGPLRNQAKIIAWSYLKHFTAVIPSIKVNESELSIYLPNSSTIRIFGADNPDSLRGLYFDGIILDEVAQMRAEVWEEIVRPALSDRLGWAVFIGTPKGVNLFFDLYQYATDKMNDKKSDWIALSYPVTETNALDENEVKTIKETLSDNAFRQEYMCDFSASADNVLITLDDMRKAMTSSVRLEDQSAWPLVLGVDVARYGEDATVFFSRRGLYAYDQPLIFRKLDTLEVAHQLVSWIALNKPEYVFIDQGQGVGVIDIVRSLAKRFDTVISEVPFGSQADEPDKYLNKRAEMWCRIREWIRSGGRLPNDLSLEAELTAPTYEIDAAGRIKLEPKDKIKERLKRSVDRADALCLTFAVNLPALTIALERKFDKYGLKSSQKMTELLTNQQSYDDEVVFEW